MTYTQKINSLWPAYKLGCPRASRIIGDAVEDAVRIFLNKRAIYDDTRVDKVRDRIYKVLKYYNPERNANFQAYCDTIFTQALSKKNHDGRKRPEDVALSVSGEVDRTLDAEMAYSLTTLHLDDIYASLYILNERERKTIRLFLKGFSLQEIADKCQVSHETIRRAYHFASQKLREYFETNHYSGSVSHPVAI